MELDGAPATRDDLAPLGLVNYGHFTSMLVEDGAVRGLELHLDRLVRDCQAVFAVDLDPERLRAEVRGALGGNSGRHVVRVTVYDPDITLAKPGAAANPRLLVTSRPAAAVDPGPLRVQSAVYSRDLPAIKHTGLFGALHHRAGAQRAGFDDVLLTDADGRISEIATSNIGFITADATLVWPEADMLVGTTMRLISRARDETVVSRRVSLAQLDQFVGAFATNAAVGVRAVTAIDEHRWAEHELVEILRKTYESIPAQPL
ncbi:aminotransferase class IV family protein [Nocardia noduli]|uniref:aminotransferase class IV family protein n=1 Tax=Nocardia noduli TaxID=2815722 RepID=UPI001C22999D|nr:aminotransferase class IV family protein [Nocardia noduli]